MFCHKKLKYILPLLIILILASCGVRKNTRASRGFHAFTTRYNVLFNGKQSYEEGLVNIEKAHKEDYSKIIPMYPISVHSNALSAVGNMERTIEKSQKAIRLHSIQKKPKKDPKKARDPKYIAFMEQEEYNKMIDDAWLLMGKAQFHAADFLAAIGSFTYVIRHFAHEENSVTEAKIWMARSYAEMGWFYEAEDVLYKLSEVDMPKDLSILYASATADLNIKQGNYSIAIPYLEMASTEERSKYLQTRFNYVLAQLYQELGENEKAAKIYTQVIKMNPPYEMAFNAKINQTEVYSGGNTDEMLKELRKMAKDNKNIDYLDKIYYAIANVYMREGNEEEAIENYKLAIEKSTRNGYEKAAALTVLGDLYYDQSEYERAQVYYEEAELIVDANYKDYQHILQRATSLNELVGYQQQVVLQDSLLVLAAMPEEERGRAINKIIAQVRIEEQQEQERLRLEEEKAKREELRMQGENMTNMGVGNIPGMVGDNSWYFYNPTLVRTGKNEFIRKFGSRKLEDDWQRRNKVSLGFDLQLMAELEAAGDTAALAALDNKKPEYYLKQIPLTEEQVVASNAIIANSLYGMGVVYYDKIEDYPKSIESFEELHRRYPQYEKTPESYFYLNQIGNKLENKELSDDYKNKLIAEYPQTRFAKMLTGTTAKSIQTSEKMIVDSLYEDTYKAYLASNYQHVFENTKYVIENYPDTDLNPKFLFLKALCTARVDSRENFKEELKYIIQTYPTSDVVSMSKDMIALLEQGLDPEATGSPNSLVAKREATIVSEDEFVENLEKAGFVSDPTLPHQFVFLIEDSITDMNKLLFEVASYNFTRFLIKDFDLEVKKLATDLRVLSVKPLENLDEAIWYQNQMTSSLDIKHALSNSSYLAFVISEDNYNQLTDSASVVKYLDFYLQNKLLLNKSDIVKEIESSTGFVAENSKPETPVSPEKQQKPAVTTKEKNENPVDELSKIITEIETIEDSAPVKEEKEEIQAPVRKLHKGYVYEENIPLYFVILVNNDLDIKSMITAFEEFNKENSGISNLKLKEDAFGKYKAIINGELSNIISARSYMNKAIGENSLYETVPRTAYRTFIISEENLNRLKTTGNLTAYFEFMRDMYFK